MKRISVQTIADAVVDLCRRAAYDLPVDVHDALAASLDKEESPTARSIIRACLDNAAIAKEKQMAICQDTGFAVYLVELGLDVQIEGGTLQQAIDAGTERGWRECYLRSSIVNDPLFDRINTKTNTPAIVHIEQVQGDSLVIHLAPKGGGSENMSAVSMLKPSDGVEGVIKFVTDSVIRAGGNPCPPVIVGVGIGGTFEKCAFLAKKALFRKTGAPSHDLRYANLEQQILASVNQSGIGPQGLGGTVTALAVHIETHPCHIASMPVAVNLNCHAARHASMTL